MKKLSKNIYTYLRTNVFNSYNKKMLFKFLSDYTEEILCVIGFVAFIIGGYKINEILGTFFVSISCFALTYLSFKRKQQIAATNRK